MLTGSSPCRGRMGVPQLGVGLLLLTEEEEEVGWISSDVNVGYFPASLALNS